MGPWGRGTMGLVNTPPASQPNLFLRGALIVLAVVQAVSAIGGALAMVFGDGAGFDESWLDPTPFTSYQWPGVILAVVVGGTQVLAVIAQLRRRHLAWELHAAAGLVMLIWIFVELAMMMEWFVLQGVMFATGTLQVVLAVLALGAWPRR